jgi:hypothetical protein
MAVENRTKSVAATGKMHLLFCSFLICPCLRPLSI